ncbi:PilZ domain-containing protein [Planctobacterium marinum]|uniref:PilZ domain-containing protein n=1 Tax=Planctobacterium marinum TaxID=1631968 RepID=UPI001E4B22E2|nr:PilZ domain-containing protein [Planctobacterium marinum]MCC2604386.1 PilZ domain-containing protein [Planctobacterium marinum]
MLGYDDKRAFFRMMMNSPCTLLVNGDGAKQKISALCRDISATGMSFEVPEALQVGDEMEVNIESTSDQISSLCAIVKVVRQFEENDSTFVVGTEVVQMM